MKLSHKVFCILGLTFTASFVVIIFQPCVKLSDEWNNVVTGLFTSSAVVLMIESISLLHVWVNLSKLKGNYNRTRITEWSSDLGKHVDIIDQCSSNDIVLEYKGEGEYKGTATYQQGEVDITINLDKANPNVGNGIYQYKDKNITDLGTYEIQIDRNDANKIYINYSNVISSDSAVSGLARGYEIWEKK
jgi:hypothetical protein